MFRFATCISQPNRIQILCTESFSFQRNCAPLVVLAGTAYHEGLIFAWLAELTIRLQSYITVRLVRLPAYKDSGNIGLKYTCREGRVDRMSFDSSLFILLHFISLVTRTKRNCAALLGSLIYFKLFLSVFQFIDVPFYCVSLQCTLSLAAQCIVIGPVCGCVCVCSFVCGSVTTITRNCVHQSSPNWVCR